MVSTNTAGASVELSDEAIAERREIGSMSPDMVDWRARADGPIEGLDGVVRRVVCGLVGPVMLGMVYEVVARKLFTAPTIRTFDISRKLCGARFLLSAAHVFSRGLHIRSDFLHHVRKVRTRARRDIIGCVVFFFPAMLLFYRVSSDCSFASIEQMERSTETAWMPPLGPVQACILISALFPILQCVSELLKRDRVVGRGRW